MPSAPPTSAAAPATAGPAVRFRRVEPRDLDTLLDLMADFYHHERIPYDREVSRRVVGDLLAAPRNGGVWFLETDDAAPAGYVVLCVGYSLEFRGRDAFLDELYVVPACRGHGLGTAALAFAEATARTLDVVALHLEVDHDNPRAHALYRATGYADHPRHLMTKKLV